MRFASVEATPLGDLAEPIATVYGRYYLRFAGLAVAPDDATPGGVVG